MKFKEVKLPSLDKYIKRYRIKGLEDDTQFSEREKAIAVAW